jgi:hypothetical protein
MKSGEIFNNLHHTLVSTRFLCRPDENAHFLPQISNKVKSLHVKNKHAADLGFGPLLARSESLRLNWRATHT